MDIHAKLLETVDANDPQFNVLLSNAIKTEIAELEEELKVKRNRNQRKKEELAFVLERRKNLKKSVEEKSKLSNSIRRAVYCLQDYSKEMIEKVEMTKKTLDEDSLKKIRHIKEIEKLRDIYQKQWEEYEDQFEASPHAIERKLAKEELEKVEIQLGIIKMNIQVMKRNVREYENLKESKFQKNIIQIADIWLKHRDNVENLKKLKQEDAKLKVEIANQEKRIQALIKEKENEERQKALARFQMPPPIMDQTFMETIMSQYSQSTPKQQKRQLSKSFAPNYKDKGSLDDFDSVSISSSIFEMCIAEKPNSANTQEIEQVRDNPDTYSLLSNHNREFATDNNQQNIMMYSPEKSSREIVRSSQTPLRTPQLEKPVLEKSETSKRPANSPQESQIHKKPHDVYSKMNINPNEKNPQEKSTLDLETMKIIQENMRRQDKRPDTPVPERSKVPEDNNCQSVLPKGIGNLNPENTCLLSRNSSYLESVNSNAFSEQNNIEKGTELDLISDASMLSNPDEQTNSLNFSEEEISNARSDNNFIDTNAVNPDPSASAPTGMFAIQKKSFFNFQGFFPK